MVLKRIWHALQFARQHAARWRVLEANLQGLRNEVNALQVSIAEMRSERDANDAHQRRLLSDMTDTLARLMISARIPAQYRPQPCALDYSPARPYSIEEKLSSLRSLHPAAYDTWFKAFEAGRRAYEIDPVINLSVDGHPDAEIFRAFISPYMSGSVLDIGCGPQELPVYLRGFDLERVAGLDPLPGGARRQIEFCQGFAEFLPWEAAQFDVVLFATSLDHVLSLERTLAEVCRVLRPRGKCIVWAGLVPGSAPYEPDREPVVAVDQYHLFHFSEETLLQAFKPKFDLYESCVYRKFNGFYVFNKVAAQ